MFLIRNTKSSIIVRKINCWKNTSCYHTIAAGIPHLKLSLYISSVLPIHRTFVFTSPKEYYLLLLYNLSWKLQRKTSNQKDGTKKFSKKTGKKLKKIQRKENISAELSVKWSFFFFPLKVLCKEAVLTFSPKNSGRHLILILIISKFSRFSKKYQLYNLTSTNLIAPLETSILINFCWILPPQFLSFSTGSSR